MDILMTIKRPFNQDTNGEPSEHMKAFQATLKMLGISFAASNTGVYIDIYDNNGEIDDVLIFTPREISNPGAVKEMVERVKALRTERDES